MSAFRNPSHDPDFFGGLEQQLPSLAGKTVFNGFCGSTRYTT